MAQTQKMYLGEVPVIRNYLGEDPIVSAAATISFPYEVEYLVYAAGGRGGNRISNNGGGGGAGGLLSGSLFVNPFEVYQVRVGQAQTGNGDDSYLTGSNAYIYAFGGGKGGDGNNNAGSNGGSGGGGGGNTGVGGTGVSGQGFSGANGQGGGQGGGGGGAGAAAFNVNGGVGKTSSISGISRTYCEGGRAGSADAGNNVSGSGGRGGLSGTPTGTLGGPGQVIIRYFGVQKGSGGVVTTDGDYTIHTFSTPGTSSYTG